MHRNRNSNFVTFVTFVSFVLIGFGSVCRDVWAQAPVVTFTKDVAPILYKKLNAKSA